MKKLTSIKLGNLIGNLYENNVSGITGYTYKIYLGKQTRGQLIAQSYTYISSKIGAMEKMSDEMKLLIDLSQDLFDFSKIERI